LSTCFTRLGMKCTTRRVSKGSDEVRVWRTK
jgi:hypothetical protein